MLAAALGTSPGAAAAEPPTLERLVAEKAGAVDLVRHKAEKNLVTAAQDPAFAAYFAAGTDEERRALRGRIERITLGVQARLGIDEMCLIDRRGWEVSRIVAGRVAGDLSRAEAGNPFFAPAFALEPRAVYATPVYVSQDTGRWVVGYATPIVAGGEKRAILHYEQPLEVLRAAVAWNVEPARRAVLLLDEDGRVVADSRGPVPAGDLARFAWRGLDLAALRALTGVADEGAGEGAAADGTRVRAAFRRVRDWLVVGVDGG